MCDLLVLIASFGILKAFLGDEIPWMAVSCWKNKMTKSRWGFHTEDYAFSAREIEDIRPDGWNRLYELRARRLTRSLDVFFIVGDRGPNEPEPLRGFGGCE